MKRHAVRDNGIGDRAQEKWRWSQSKRRGRKWQRQAYTENEKHRKEVMQSRKLKNSKQWIMSVSYITKNTGKQNRGTQEENTNADSVIQIEEDGHPGKKREKRDRRNGPGCRSKGRLPVGIDRITWLPNVTVSALPVAQPSSLMRLPLPGLGGLDRCKESAIQDCSWSSPMWALSASSSWWIHFCMCPIATFTVFFSWILSAGLFTILSER